MADGIAQGIQIANALFNPLQENIRDKRQMRRRMEEMQMQAQLKSQLEQQELDRKQQLAEKWFNQGGTQAANVIPEAAIGERTLSQVARFRPQEGQPIPEFKTQHGMKTPAYQDIKGNAIDPDVLSRTLNLPSAVPGISKTNFFDPTSGDIDVKGYNKALQEYQQKTAEEQKTRELLASLPSAQQEELAQYFGDIKGFNKGLADSNKRGRQGATGLKLFADDELMKNLTAEELADLDPQFINQFMKGKQDREDRQQAAKERQQTAFENQKAIKEFGKSVGRAVSGGGKPLKHFNQETGRFEFFDPNTGAKIQPAGMPAIKPPTIAAPPVRKRG